MDVLWTQPCAFPKKLYRVYRRGQHTAWNPRIGFVASSDSFYFFDTQLSDFISSLVNHRRQVRNGSPYISFFEDFGEAEAWCMAAENVFQQKCLIAILHLDSPVIQQGLQSGSLKAWRLTDIMDGGRCNIPELMPGRSDMASSEWFFLRYVPATAITVYKLNSTGIRNKYCIPRVIRTFRCACGEMVEYMKMHHCWVNKMRLECGCRWDMAYACPHFDWPVKPEDDKEDGHGGEVNEELGSGMEGVGLNEERTKSGSDKEMVETSISE